MFGISTRAGLALLGVLSLVVIPAGCGGSSGGSSDGETGSFKEVCLEAREGIGMSATIRRTCAEHGVTATAPPPTSPAAREARARNAAANAREEQKANEEPVTENYNRSAAMADLATGEPEAAREALADGCPKSTPSEVDEAFEQLQEIVSGPEAGSVQQLQEELEEICPM